MKEVAKVKSVDNDLTTVYLEKKDECSKCGMCLFPANAKGVTMNAKNTVNAREGDDVIIEIKDDGKLLGIFLAFIVPLILIGLSFLVNWLFIKNEIYTLIIAVISIVIWYVVLSFIDKKLKKNDKYGAEIITVLKTKIQEKQSNTNEEKEMLR